MRVLGAAYKCGYAKIKRVVRRMSKWVLLRITFSILVFEF